MKEGAWLEVCDGKGLLVEAQLRGLTFSNTAFATATSNVQHVGIIPLPLFRRSPPPSTHSQMMFSQPRNFLAAAVRSCLL
jgi:hypothetical protein